MSKPTPGPYHVRRVWSNGCEVCPEIWAGDEWVATVVGAPYLGHERTLPTAELLAAAPELLEALETMRKWAIPGMNWTDDIRQEILALVDAAIAKAKRSNR